MREKGLEGWDVQDPMEKGREVAARQRGNQTDRKLLTQNLFSVTQTLEPTP